MIEIGTLKYSPFQKMKSSRLPKNSEALGYFDLLKDNRYLILSDNSKIYSFKFILVHLS